MNVKKMPGRQDATLMNKGAVLAIPGTEVYYDKDTGKHKAGELKRATFLVVAKHMNPAHQAAQAAFFAKMGGKGFKNVSNEVYKEEDDRQLAEFVFIGWLMDGTYSDPSREWYEVEVEPWTTTDESGNEISYPPTLEHRIEILQDQELETLRAFIVAASKNNANYAKRTEEEVTKNS